MPDPSLLPKALPESVMLEIYKDLAKPTVKNLGEALGATLGMLTGPTILVTSNLRKNLENYAKRLGSIKNDDKKEVLPEIGIPILDKLRHSTSEELTQMYIELLLKASTKRGNAHPSYIGLIANLSPEEGKLLYYIKLNYKSIGLRNIKLPFIEISGEYSKGSLGSLVRCGQCSIS